MCDANGLDDGEDGGPAYMVAGSVLFMRLIAAHVEIRHVPVAAAQWESQREAETRQEAGSGGERRDRGG